MNSLASTPEFTTKVTPAFKMTAGLPFKIIGAVILVLLGSYYLALGKKNGEVGKMILGAMLTIAGCLLF